MHCPAVRSVSANQALSARTPQELILSLPLGV